MNTKLLKAESKDLKVAYLLYFVLQAPYAYIGKGGYQILYWMVAGPFYGSIFSLFGVGVETEMGFLGIVGYFITAVLLAIWPVNMFFALPNLLKRENLRLYEIMRSKK